MCWIKRVRFIFAEPKLLSFVDFWLLIQWYEFSNFSDQQWHVFTGNEIGTLLGWWALENCKLQWPEKDLKDCYMLASTVSSKMLRAMAKAEGFNFIETLTGFKWMGNRSYELINEGKTVLFAFEEAIGFMFSPTVLDKDGVSAACHLANLATFLQTKNQTLGGKLNELYTHYGFHYTSNSYFLCYEPDVIVKIFERIRNFQRAPNTASPLICLTTSNVKNNTILKCLFFILVSSSCF